MAAAKKKTSPRSRTSAANKKKGFEFKWWMALIGVVVIAGVGVAVLRFSRAAVVDPNSQSVRNANRTLVNNFNECQSLARDNNGPINLGNYSYNGDRTAAIESATGGPFQYACTKSVQSFINVFNANAGFPLITVDGSYGAQTEQYVNALKNAYNSTVYGGSAETKQYALSAGLPLTMNIDGRADNAFLRLMSIITYVAASNQ